MRVMKTLGVVVFVAMVGAAGLWAWSSRLPANLAPPAGKYDVRILRDEWGVPHIYGQRDADTAYGLAYAQCEDDFATAQEALIMTRGEMAAVQGKDAAPLDFLVKLFRFRDLVEREYEKQLSPEVRAVCEAYADGVNHFASLHPKAVLKRLFPVTGKDIVAGFVVKGPFFFGLDNEVMRLFGDKRAREVSQKKPAQAAPAASVPAVPGVPIAAAEDDWRTEMGSALTQGLPFGSNTFAVAPSRTPDGRTRLAINSHQPWTGPVAWYEARLKSEEGLDIVGGVFPGAPVILHGHNRSLGWAHTVNTPDLIDVYVLEMNPDNPNQYQFDGAWRDLEVFTIPITVRLWGGFHWTVKREGLWCVYGPVVRQPHGVYAIRYAGYDNIRQVEQWYRMGKARTLDEFLAAMRIQGFPSLNVGYADKAGNIMYIYNARLPLRAPGYDWKMYLPGDTSDTLWSEFLPFDQVPRVLNPPSGFIQNCNSSPFKTTVGAGNPDPAAFAPELGVEGPDVMTNRALRALELFGPDESITPEEFYAYKYDVRYSAESNAAKARDLLVNAPPPNDPLTAQAQELLRRWDLSTDFDNPCAAIGVMTVEAVVRQNKLGDARAALAILGRKAKQLQDSFGRLDVPWKEVNRLDRGEISLGLSGGPDILHAVYGNW
ncbi:MAG: acylase, partial [Candidatus Hydrogenedentes bacterium]|nr:acylase [Candidatus Hydrogenedentota bacterium]